MGFKDFPGYRQQTSILRTVDEPKLKKKFNWDRLFFFVLLVFLLFYSGQKMYKKVAQIRVNGQVILDKMSVNFTDPIRIKKMLVNEGDEVSAGDSLFSYVVENNKEDPYIKTYNRYDGNSNWFLREKLNVKRQIELKKSEREGVRTLIALKKQELEDLKKRVYLGTELSHKLDPVKMDIKKMENDIDAMNSEIGVLNEYYSTLKSQEVLALNEENLRIEAEILARQQFNKLILYYTTPIPGLIGQIEKQENEVCYTSESVMTIHRSGMIKVKAYFSPENANDIAVGDEVTLRFEDGTESEGIIQNFYISTYPLPPEFQKRYEPTTRSIVADVVPKNGEDTQHWLGYYKMGVQVIKSRFKFF
ncbi:MAG: HlyD family efflux transporter periplasmic adaptor subunit [Lewinellaceae bacterium]|nr:HlyD family efflux transporter periplasmic adaptor subunit [Saprospiraceae bacterium]MCB9339891.1 HlyD family efflux transporter periplasmic adaptor subunit [Lewinellaceae bacterium]